MVVTCQIDSTRLLCRNRHLIVYEMDYRQIPAFFVADAPGLDFLNSIATPVDQQVDWIADGEGLVAWLEQAEWVPMATLAEITSQSTSAELDAVAAQARVLREWFRDFVNKKRGRPLVARHLRQLAPLNQLLARDERYGKIVADLIDAAEGGTTFKFRETRRWHSAESLLMPIAEALARLVCDEDFTYMKACEGTRCTLMFVDRTRGHARRWCSMAICGNRAKVAAHRKRLKGQKSG